MSLQAVLPSNRTAHQCDLPLSDLNLAIAASKQTGTPLPIGGLTTTLYNALTNREEFADRDFSVVFEYLRIAQAGGMKKTDPNAAE